MLVTCKCIAPDMYEGTELPFLLTLMAVRLTATLLPQPQRGDLPSVLIDGLQHFQCPLRSYLHQEGSSHSHLKLRAFQLRFFPAIAKPLPVILLPFRRSAVALTPQKHSSAELEPHTLLLHVPKCMPEATPPPAQSPNVFLPTKFSRGALHKSHQSTNSVYPHW